jgi:hypothetical protein
MPSEVDEKVGFDWIIGFLINGMSLASECLRKASKIRTTICCGPARAWPRTNTSRRRGVLPILAAMRKDSAWSQLIR